MVLRKIPLISFFKQWKMLFILVLVSGSATAQSMADEKDGIGAGRYIWDTKGDISALIYLSGVRQEECRYVEKLMWGNPTGPHVPGSWCPREVAQKLVVHYQKKPVIIPASVYMDLSSIHSIAIEPGTKDELYSVKIKGSDAGYSYRAIIQFAGTTVLSRAVHLSEFPGSVWEKTRYVFSTPALTSVRGKQLLKASVQGDDESVRHLLQAGADPDAKDEDGYTALMLAIIWNHFGVVEQLLQFGADSNVKSKNKASTALMTAAYWGLSKVVRHLLQSDADPDAKNVYGETALMMAARKGRSKIVRDLLNAGANPNLKFERFGLTALMMAAWYGDEESVRYLLESGAEPSVKDEYIGRTAFEWAEDEEVQRLLQSWEALKAKDKAGLDAHVAGTSTFADIPFDAGSEQFPETVEQDSGAQDGGMEIALKNSADMQLMSATKGGIKARLYLLDIEHNECRHAEKLMWGSPEEICPGKIVYGLVVRYQGKMVYIPASAYIDLAEIHSISIEPREEDELYSLVIKGGDAAYSYDVIITFIGPEIFHRSLRYSRPQNNTWQRTLYKDDIPLML